MVERGRRVVVSIVSVVLLFLIFFIVVGIIMVYGKVGVESIRLIFVCIVGVLWGDEFVKFCMVIICVVVLGVFGVVFI